MVFHDRKNKHDFVKTLHGSEKKKYVLSVRFPQSHYTGFIVLQWNLYNETGKVLLKTHKFHHLSGTVFTKSFLSYPLHCNCLPFEMLANSLNL